MKKTLTIIAIALGLMAGSSGASAWWYGGYYGHHYYGGYYGRYYGGPYYRSYYRPYYYNGGCRWIPGHRDYYGYWVPGHRACW